MNERKLYVDRDLTSKNEQYRIVYEEKGFTVRDGIALGASTAFGIAMSVFAHPILCEVIPEAAPGVHQVIRKVGIIGTDFVIGEIAEHSARRAFNEAFDASDKLVEDDLIRKAKKVAEEATEDKKSNDGPKARNVREAKK